MSLSAPDNLPHLTQALLRGDQIEKKSYTSSVLLMYVCMYEVVCVKYEPSNFSM